MKRYMTYLVLTSLMFLSALAVSADELYIDSIRTVPGTETMVLLKMRNSETIVGFQLDLVLPEGVTLNYYAMSGERTVGSFELYGRTLEDGTYRLVCMPVNSISPYFAGTDGSVVALYISSAAIGEMEIGLKNQHLTTSDLRELAPLDGCSYLKVMSKCATPEVMLEKGTVTFSCATEGAEFHYTITPHLNTITSVGTSGVKLASDYYYTVTVYASAPDHEDSDTCIKTLAISQSDINQDGKVSIADVIELIGEIKDDESTR